MQADDTEDESDTRPTLTAYKGRSDMDSVNDTKDALWDLERVYFHSKDQGNVLRKRHLSELARVRWDLPRERREEH